MFGIVKEDLTRIPLTALTTIYVYPYLVVLVKELPPYDNLGGSSCDPDPPPKARTTAPAPGPSSSLSSSRFEADRPGRSSGGVPRCRTLLPRAEHLAPWSRHLQFPHALFQNPGSTRHSGKTPRSFPRHEEQPPGTSTPARWIDIELT
jgi:hypothetical protein